MLQAIKALLANQPILSVSVLFGSALLLLYPGDKTPDNLPAIPYLDVAIHIFLFAACAFSLYFDFIVKKQPSKPFLLVLLFTFFLLLFGGIVEILQEQYLNRTGSLEDFLADGLGVVLGFGFAYLVAPQFYDWVISN